MTEKELVRVLAEVSHASYMKHYRADSSRDQSAIIEDVNEHDTDRAESIVEKLKELNMLKPFT